MNRIFAGNKHKNMSERGVTRPMEMHGMHEQGQSMPEDRSGLLESHHGKTLWIYWSLIILGAWMILTPATFSFFQQLSHPAGDRHLWIEAITSLQILKISDVTSGFLLIILGARSLAANRPVSLWLCCAVGVWLNAAPLILWSPSALVYLNDTMIGTLVIALTILIPGMPNMINYMKMGPEAPEGWSYNPSSWPQRSILIALGFAGWMVSRYLAAYQFGYIPHVWDPFFGDGTRHVLTSEMSRSLPISDAGLGTFAYTFEFLMGWMGSSSRWRTMPWMVALFGILVIPLGLVHIFLVISQPLTVGAWCAFCLLAAAIMLPMIPLEVDEVTAMIQFLRRKVKSGVPFWTTFWKGGGEESMGTDERSPQISGFAEHPAAILKSSVWGMSCPRTLIGAALLGLWLMFSPALFGSPKASADLQHLTGALVVTFSVIAMGEVIRSLRWINIGVVMFALVRAWTMPLSTAESMNVIAVGFLIAVLSCFKGPIRERYGEWNKFIL